MNVTRIPLSELKAPDRNVRIHTAQQIKEFIRSVTMFGQIRPVVVDEDYVVLAGNGLVEALTEMGKTEADVLVMKNLSEHQKKKLMIADNKIFSLGIENLETLNAFLEELEGDLDIPGFDEDILKTMVADGEEVTERIAEYGTLDEQEIAAIRDRNERRAPLESKVEDFDSKTAQTPDITPHAITTEDNEAVETAADIRKFVVCPHCGEKIWL